MTLAEYNNETQMFRDEFEMMWSTQEKDSDRANAIILETLKGQNAAEVQKEITKSKFIEKTILSIAKGLAGDDDDD
jgi:pyrroline-5-carboxylate reductase